MQFTLEEDGSILDKKEDIENTATSNELFDEEKQSELVEE